jgi:hypothetical protein
MPAPSAYLRTLRIPFFFEPNFEANVKALTAVHRLQAVESDGSSHSGGKTSSVVYGQFLLKKVGKNFAGGKYV